MAAPLYAIIHKPLAEVGGEVVTTHYYLGAEVHDDFPRVLAKWPLATIIRRSGPRAPWVEVPWAYDIGD